MPFDYRNSQTGTGEPNLTRWTGGCSRFALQYENTAGHNRRTCQSIADGCQIKKRSISVKEQH